MPRVGPVRVLLWYRVRPGLPVPCPTQSRLLCARLEHPAGPLEVALVALAPEPAEPAGRMYRAPGDALHAPPQPALGEDDADHGGGV